MYSHLILGNSLDYFQVLITKIDHKEKNDQNISFNR